MAVERSAQFQLLSCMDPATDVGKRQLALNTSETDSQRLTADFLAIGGLRPAITYTHQDEVSVMIGKL